MNYSNQMTLLLATLTYGLHPSQTSAPTEYADQDQHWQQLIEPALTRLQQLIDDFRQQPVTPAATHQFEQQMQDEARELCRQLTQWTYNHLEPDTDQLPSHVWFEASEYTRLNKKTPQNVWTLFGHIRLWRACYRPTSKTGDPGIFPLALSLGLVHGATPALAERAAYLMGSTGMTQKQTLQRLRQDCSVGWGVKKLRQVTEAVAEAMSAQRHEVQVQKVLEWLEQAYASKGRHKPVLSVGRDGITMKMGCRGGHVKEVATTATVTVLDRRGERVGTVYLAYVPESGQATMSQALTKLLREVLQRWQRPLPRLCYVSDAGDNETSYYERVLRRMKHPRSGEPLEWLRVLDYYHASERIWTMAELLFGKGRSGTSWAKKMLKWLLKPGGVNRVLHSAAAYRKQYELKDKKLSDFDKAYRYLRVRMKYMRYAEYKKLGVPLGSGVTEAGCKTVYTQRLKLSGMRWQKAGAQTILELRVLQLSGVWERAYERVLESYGQAQVRVQQANSGGQAKKAA